MTNRVLLNNQFLRVSKAGYDVLTTGKDNLNFSSEWAGLALLLRGSFNSAPNTPVTIFFGKTFSIPPIVEFASRNGPSLPWYFFTGANAVFELSYIQILTDRMIIGNPGNTTVPYHYTIWDYTL